MSRTPNQTRELAAAPDISPAAEQAVVLAQQNAAAVQQATERAAASYAQDRDLINQILGQAQALQASSDLLRTGAVSKHALVKQNRLYTSLKGIFTPHGAELKGTWEEYCTLLGRSVDMVDRDIANLQAFGEEALESMTRAGIGYRDLAKFRKLAPDQKQELIEAAKAGDKETFLDVAETLIARHSREKEEAQKALDEQRKTAEALEDMVSDKDARIRELRVSAEKRRVALTDWPAEFGGYISQVAEARRSGLLKLGAIEIVMRDALVQQAAAGEEEALESAHRALAEEVASTLEVLTRRAEEITQQFNGSLAGFLPD